MGPVIFGVMCRSDQHMSIVEDQVTIPGPTPLPAFIARPQRDEPKPAVIIFPEIFGLNDSIRNVARNLASAGYVALAPDFFRHAPTPYDDFQGARQVASCLSDTGAMSDTAAALDYLHSLPYVRPGKSAVLGYCMGGRLAFLAACHHPASIGACVDYYGARLIGGRTHDGQTMIPLDDAPAIECPVLFFFGEQDDFIPAEERETIRSRMQSLGKSHEIHVYPGAGHGFSCESRSSFHAEASADAWRRTLEFLSAALASPAGS